VVLHYYVSSMAVYGRVLGRINNAIRYVAKLAYMSCAQHVFICRLTSPTSMSDVSASSLLAAGGLLAAAAAAAAANAGVAAPQTGGPGCHGSGPTIGSANSSGDSADSATMSVAAAAAAAAMTRLNWERYQRAAAAMRYSPYNLHPPTSALGPTASLPGLCCTIHIISYYVT
jgi:hypothetical protein